MCTPTNSLPDKCLVVQMGSGTNGIFDKRPIGEMTPQMNDQLYKLPVGSVALDARNMEHTADVVFSLSD